jgi:hypothetical protein
MANTIITIQLDVLQLELIKGALLAAAHSNDLMNLPARANELRRLYDAIQGEQNREAIARDLFKIPHPFTTAAIKSHCSICGEIDTHSNHVNGGGQ